MKKISPHSDCSSYFMEIKNEKKYSINNKVFYVEIVFYMLSLLLFIYMQARNVFFLELAEKIYITFIILSFGYLFLTKYFFVRYDVVFHRKMFKKYFVKGRSESRPGGYKRKGIYKVIVLWILYLAFIAIIKQTGLLTWQLFLCGACIMFMLNSFFARKLCLLSVFFYITKIIAVRIAVFAIGTMQFLQVRLYLHQTFHGRQLY